MLSGGRTAGKGLEAADTRDCSGSPRSRYARFAKEFGGFEFGSLWLRALAVAAGRSRKAGC